jgi:hypothetical protein
MDDDRRAFGCLAVGVIVLQVAIVAVVVWAIIRVVLAFT